MGREIIREKSPEELEERCRLWFHEDVLPILSEQTGTKAIKGLALKENLVSIELENSNVKFMWKEAQMMEKLKILNLSHSHFLTDTPDFSYLPNLEKLVLKDCPMLYEVSPSIGDLTKILLIDLEDCVEDGFDDMESLTTLLKYVPSSCSHELSSFSNQLPMLQSLLVECSSELQLSQDTAIILDALHATNYKESEPTAILEVFFNSNGNELPSHDILKEKILQNIDINGSGGYLPGDSYPDWLTFSFGGSSVTFEVPQVEGRNLKTMMCVVYTSTLDNITSDGLKNVLVKNFTKATIELYKREASVSFEDEEGQRVVSSIEPGNKVEVVVVFEKNFIVKNTTVYLVYEESIGKKKNKEKKNQMSGKKKNKEKKNQMSENQFMWYLKIFVVAIVFHFLQKLLDFIHSIVL
ncbi:hypothetical protein P8452_54745 [Trifolium repens]|nr:hypothetical protein P8452_54745 [Trifolium repens]